MDSVSFAYWLQGFFELSDAKTLNEKQVACLRRHLDMVFAHEIDPSLGDPEHVDNLREIHDFQKDDECEEIDLGQTEADAIIDSLKRDMKNLGRRDYHNIKITC